MGRRRAPCPIAALAAAFVLTCCAGVAAADPGDSCAGTTDNSSVSEYCESVPSVDGPQGVRDVQRDRKSTSSKALERLQSAPPPPRAQPAATPPSTTPKPAAKAKKKAKKTPTRQARRAPKREPAVAVAVTPSRSVSTSSVFDGIPVGILVVAGLIVLAGLASARRRPSGDA